MMAYKKNASITKKDNSKKIRCANSNCAKMGRYQSENNFYSSHNEQIPFHPYCKECVNEMVNPDDLETIYGILRTLDIPFILDIWVESFNLSEGKVFIDKYLKLIDGKYSKKYSNKHWIDSEFKSDKLEVVDMPQQIQNNIGEIPEWNDDWYGDYTASDLKYLKSKLSELEKDYKITSSNHLDYIKKMCKSSLMADKYFQMVMKGDAEAEKNYKTAIATFDTLAKSAKLAESQRSANEVSLGGYGVTFNLVEQRKWIPPLQVDEKDMDIYDLILKETSNIKRSIE